MGGSGQGGPERRSEKVTFCCLPFAPICYVSKECSLLIGYCVGARQFGQISECWDLVIFNVFFYIHEKTLVTFEWF